MLLADLERELRESAGAILCDPRVIRRVIKHHRQVSGLVPHGRCYGIERDALRSLATHEELGMPLAELPEEVLLVARPSPREVGARLRGETATRLWRSVFHARIHLALQRRVAQGELDDAQVRQRIALLGQTEFDEIRSILRHDDLVMPPADDREVYIEFAALYLELKHFAPTLLLTTFPGIGDHERVRQALARDIDVIPLLERGRPRNVASPANTRQLANTSMPSFSAPAAFNEGSTAKVKPISTGAHERLMARAAKARTRGNDVRAALLSAQAARIDDKQLSRAAEAASRDALAHLGSRLGKALANPKIKEGARDWSLLLLLGARAAEERAVRYSVEARLLYTLQRAAIAFERPQTAVELSTWILSLGKRPVVRQLPATRELLVARLVDQAAKRVRNVRIGDADRKLCARLMSWASARAEANLRAALRPRILGVFDEVGLVAQNGPESLARGKVVEELIDHILHQGFLSFDAVRDALSRNQLKLDDLGNPRELWVGDALLRADKSLALALDGIYRRGDIYLRGLQKLSSIPFGTRVGRALALYLVIPLGASFVALEGLNHFVNPLLGWFGQPHIQLFHPISFLATAAAFFGLIHSSPLRKFAKQLLDLLALVLATVFFRVPGAVLGSPAVRSFVARPPVRFALRRVLLPALVGVGAYFLVPVSAWYWKAAIAGGVIAFTSVLFGSPIGALLEDFVVDQLAPTWQVISRQWLPGLLRFISRFFAQMMDLMQRSFVQVDELLRFREGQSSIMLVLKGAAGFVWAMVSYVIRLYVTLLIEPEINPLKHVPVVTVAHKLFIPFYEDLLFFAERVFSVLGSVVGPALAWMTVFFLPSVFGFLAWELKENYKLYRATRADALPPAPVGPHGETMRSLLVVGFHSGTLPKLYERLRRAAQREDEALVVHVGGTGTNRVQALGGLGRFRDGLREVEQGLRRFVERELIAVLHRSPRWTFGELSVQSLVLSSNRVRVGIACDTRKGQSAEITFEEQSGYVVAGAARAGFLARLPEEAPEQALLFENALAGLYQLAEVDLVREQIVAELGPTAHYDIADDGLVVWPREDYRTELIYAIHHARGKVIKPKVRGATPEQPPAVLDTRRMSFSDQAISWLAWVGAWTAAEREGTHVPRLLRGVSILPREETTSWTPPLVVAPPTTFPLPPTVHAAPAPMDHTLAMTQAMNTPPPPDVSTTPGASVHATVPMPEVPDPRPSSAKTVRNN